MENLNKAITESLGFQPADDEEEVETGITEDIQEETSEETIEETTEETTEETPKTKETNKVLPNTDTQETESNFDSLLSEKSKGKFKSYSDIEKALEEAPQDAFANETVAKLNEYVKSGGDVNDFLRTQTADYSKLTDVEAIREQMALSDKTLTRDEIDLLIESEYGYSEDASDRDKKLAGIKMKRAATKAREELLSYQKQWAVPQVSSEEVQAQRAIETQNWRNELNGAVDENSELEFQIDDKTFKFVPTAEAKQAVKDGYDLSKFFDRYKTKDGYDIKKFVKEMYILNNQNDILKSLITFAKGEGTAEIVDEIKNPGFKAVDNKSNDSKTKSIAEQIGEQIFQ